MSFIPPFACTRQNSVSKQTRRRILRFALAAAGSAFLPIHTSAKSREWQPEEICPDCAGRGKQTCTFCTGTGVFSIDDSFVDQSHVCPNCMGVGSIRCPSCIGLGLADTNGILRNGMDPLRLSSTFLNWVLTACVCVLVSASRDGTLRMLRSGDYEILDCSAFPACDIYGGEAGKG